MDSFRDLRARFTSGGIVFGTIIGVLLLNQALTGILLSLVYSPTATTAHDSVDRIVFGIPMGWFIRGMHVWGVHLLVVTMVVYLLRWVFQRTYVAPRQWAWVSGVLLGSVLMLSAATGQALPMDVEGFSGLTIAVSLASDIPVIGSMLVGGETAGDEVLRRAYVSHILLLPLMMVILSMVHASLVALHRPATSTPASRWKSCAAITALVVVGVLVTLAALVPPGLGPAADPAGATPENVKPYWFFLPLYEALKHVPVWMEIGVALLPVPFLLLLPRLDGGRRRTACLALIGLGGTLALVLGILGALS